MQKNMSENFLNQGTSHPDLGRQNVTKKMTGTDSCQNILVKISKVKERES